MQPGPEPVLLYDSHLWGGQPSLVAFGLNCLDRRQHSAEPLVLDDVAWANVRLLVDGGVRKGDADAADFHPAIMPLVDADLAAAELEGLLGRLDEVRDTSWNAEQRLQQRTGFLPPAKGPIARSLALRLPRGPRKMATVPNSTISSAGVRGAGPVIRVLNEIPGVTAEAGILFGIMVNICKTPSNGWAAKNGAIYGGGYIKVGVGL